MKKLILFPIILHAALIAGNADAATCSAAGPVSGYEQLAMDNTNVANCGGVMTQFFCNPETEVCAPVSFCNGCADNYKPISKDYHINGCTNTSVTVCELDCIECDPPCSTVNTPCSNGSGIIEANNYTCNCNGVCVGGTAEHLTYKCPQGHYGNPTSCSDTSACTKCPTYTKSDGTVANGYSPYGSKSICDCIVLPNTEVKDSRGTWISPTACPISC